MSSEASPQGIIAGIDIGGTFTDVVLYDPARQQLWAAKTPTTPHDPSEGFFSGLEQVWRNVTGDGRSLGRLLHGSTVATNAVLEGTGSRVGLLTTQGFRDVLEIGRANIPGIFTNYMRWAKPERLVPLERVREVPERLAADGSIVAALDEAAARARIAELLAAGIDALAISLLHAYANPAHEERLASLAQELAPDLYVTRSSTVLPEYREYERTVTTVLNAYVMPVVSRYLQGIERRLEQRGVRAEMLVVRSDAGVMSVAAARERPVNIVLSGPAGGVKGAAVLAAAAGYPNIVSIDMGGTSTDVSLSVDADPRLSTDTWVADYPIRVPIIDVATIGAGGGSIAFVSPAGALRVGPASAGADPGPACYGRGGTRPTVTDANVVLGLLPDSLADGAIALDRVAAVAAIRRHIAEPLGLSLEEAAHGIIRIVNENMLGALRVVSVQRGLDPRDLTLVPFGGAGPVHGVELARLAGIGTVLVPARPGVLSALGFLLADIRHVFTRTKIGIIGHFDSAPYTQEMERLAAQAWAWLEREQVSGEDQAVDLSVDLRYRGQAYELSIPIGLPLDSDAWHKAGERFHDEHRRRYGFDQPGAAVEVVTLRATARGALSKPSFELLEHGSAGSSPPAIGARRAFLGGSFAEVPVYRRGDLCAGHQVAGPAIIVQPDCTTVLGSGDLATVDRFANLVVKVGAP
jgi:N-methylhydantoinase A